MKTINVIQTQEKIRSYRKAHKLTQEGVAKKLGISTVAVGNWEHTNKLPSIDNFVLLAELYGVTIDELIVTESVTL